MKKIGAGCTLLITLIIFTSCSSFWAHREGDVAVSNSETAPAMVPKEQYDEMVRKYQELLESSKNLKSEQTTSENLVQNESSPKEQVKIEEAVATQLDPSLLVTQLDKVVTEEPHMPTVDVRNEEQLSEKVQLLNPTDEVDNEIERLRDAQRFVLAKNYDKALTLLKDLERAKEKQVVVRAKIMLGDLLFAQGEYDLALQIYEEVIHRFAFSGLVLNALSKLIVCTEKLKQPEKQAKYYSFLHDFFEAG